MEVGETWFHCLGLCFRKSMDLLLGGDLGARGTLYLSSISSLTDAFSFSCTGLWRVCGRPSPLAQEIIEFSVSLGDQARCGVLRLLAGLQALSGDVGTRGLLPWFLRRRWSVWIHTTL